MRLIAVSVEVISPFVPCQLIWTQVEVEIGWFLWPFVRFALSVGMSVRMILTGRSATTAVRTAHHLGVEVHHLLLLH